MTLTVHQSIELANQMVKLPPNKRTRALTILAEEAKAAGISPDVVKASRARTGKIRMVRWITFYRAHHGVGMSLPAIGRLFGYDHTTVLHAIRRVEGMIEAGELERPKLHESCEPLMSMRPMAYSAQVNMTLGGYGARGPEKHPGSQNT